MTDSQRILDSIRRLVRLLRLSGRAAQALRRHLRAPRRPARRGEQRPGADALRRRWRRRQEAEESEVTRGEFEVESATTREGLPVATSAGPILAGARIPLERSLI